MMMMMTMINVTLAITLVAINCHTLIWSINCVASLTVNVELKVY